MQHYWSLDDVSLSDAWLTIGSFDGVHRGHQKIIHGLVEAAHAAQAPAVVLTFYPHPAVVLRGQAGPFYLMKPETRAEMLGKLGIDVVITHPFSRELAAMSADEFVALLKQRLGLQQLWVGYDFALGRGREGDVPKLQQLGEAMGYSVHVVPPVEMDDQTISSSQIRTLLQGGEVARAARMLGRPYCLTGEVVHGDGRGRSIGIPTANLAIWLDQILPANGVYACHILIGEKRWAAATNVGLRPTFDGSAVLPQVEAHILDFDGDLYGQVIQLEFIERLRGEQRFASIFELVEQIRQDITQTRTIISISELQPITIPR